MVARRMPRWSELRELIRPRRPSGDGTARRLATARSPSATSGRSPGGGCRARSSTTPTVPPASEISLRRSREAFERVEFRPSVLRDVSGSTRRPPSSALRPRLPLVFAPTGFTRLMNTEGETAVGRVAARVGVPYALSTMGTTSMEALAEAAPGARRWFQLYLWRDREASRALVQRARAAGYEALVLTVDTPVAGPRLRDVRNGFSIPPALTLRTVANAAVHPRWWVDLLTTRPLDFASLRSWGGTVAELVDRVFEPAADPGRRPGAARRPGRGPLVVKGVLDAEDARAVVDAGADAVVVSNHGGRQLDRAPDAARAAARRSWRPWGTGPRSTSTAASSTAPTSSPPWRSAPAPASSAAPTSTG